MVSDTVRNSTVKKHRFTVEEYHKMGEVGIFGEDDRVELLEGEVIEMSPIGKRHFWTVNRLGEALTDRRDLGPYVVSVRNPVIVDEYGEPRPDLALLRRDASVDRLPRPEDVLLVIEVADTTLRYDREEKLPRYARAGVPEAWIVNLQDDVVELYAGPGPSGYGPVTRARRGDEAVSATIEGLSFPVSLVLG